VNKYDYSALVSTADADMLRSLLDNEISSFSSFMSNYETMLADQVADNNHTLELSVLNVTRQIGAIGQSIAQTDVQISDAVDSISQELNSLDDESIQVQNMAGEVQSVLKDDVFNSTIDVMPILTLVPTNDDIRETKSDTETTVDSAITEVNNLISQVTR